MPVTPRLIRASLFALMVLGSSAARAAGPDADELLLRDIRDADYASASHTLNAANPNRPLPDGSTPLGWAVESQDPQMVRLLLDKGASPDGAGHFSTPPLITACRYGEPHILQMLLAAHPNVNVARPDGVSALEVCAGFAPTAIVERLIGAGAQVEHADGKGQTPLMWAAAHARIDTMGVLLAHHAAVNRTTRQAFSPLFFALKSGDPAAPVALLAAGADADHVGPDGTTVVQLAMYQKDYAFAARMIRRGADLSAFDRNGNQLLHAAVLAHQPDLVKLLIDKGAHINATTGTSKVEWRYERNFKSAQYFVPPKPALLLAAEHGFTDLMQMLVDAGADPHFQAVDGTDVLLAAATSGSRSALDLALRLQPDANVTNSTGQTALHLVLDMASDDDGEGSQTGAMMTLLAQHGARADIRDHAGHTAADMALDFPPRQFGGVRQQFETIFKH